MLVVFLVPAGRLMAGVALVSAVHMSIALARVCFATGLLRRSQFGVLRITWLGGRRARVPVVVAASVPAWIVHDQLPCGVKLFRSIG
jgi:hypothetical protein